MAYQRRFGESVQTTLKVIPRTNNNNNNSKTLQIISFDRNTIGMKTFGYRVE